MYTQNGEFSIKTVATANNPQIPPQPRDKSYSETDLLPKWKYLLGSLSGVKYLAEIIHEKLVGR